jgi:hypothetical protein
MSEILTLVIGTVQGVGGIAILLVNRSVAGSSPA